MKYLVNAQTKEHKLCNSDGLPPRSWFFVPADADGWIEWSGGNLPLPREHPVECKIVGGKKSKGQASEMPFSSYSPVWRVVAYRPILDAPAEAMPQWNGEGLPPVGTVCEVSQGGGWTQCEVIAHFKNRVAMVAAFTVEVHGDAKRLDSCIAECFRPTLDDEPQAPKWDGEGIPPVGTDDGKWVPEVGDRVQVRRNDNDWREVTVVAHDDGGVIYRDPATTDHRYKWAIGGGIRPIPTEEDRAIEDMARVLSDNYADVVDLVRPFSEFIGPARALYNAGYRKQPTEDTGDRTH